MFAGKKSAQIREILISESAWEEMTCLFAPSLDANNATDLIKIKALAEMLDISYPALKQRIHRGQDVDTAIRELLAKGGE